MLLRNTVRKRSAPNFDLRHLTTSTSNMATPAVGTPVVEEGKLLSESLSTVKIQVGQMRRYLVRIRSFADCLWTGGLTDWYTVTGT